MHTKDLVSLSQDLKFMLITVVIHLLTIEQSIKITTAANQGVLASCLADKIIGLEQNL